MKHYIIDMKRAEEFLSSNLHNPTENFKAIAIITSDIRTIAKREGMYSDLYVVDLNILDGNDTVEVITNNPDGTTTIKTEPVEFENTKLSLIINKTALLQGFNNLKEKYGSIKDRKVLIVAFNKRGNFIPFLVMDYNEAMSAGLIKVKANEEEDYYRQYMEEKDEMEEDIEEDMEELGLPKQKEIVKSEDVKDRVKRLLSPRDKNNSLTL